MSDDRIDRVGRKLAEMKLIPGLTMQSWQVKFLRELDKLEARRRALGVTDEEWKALIAESREANEPWMAAAHRKMMSPKRRWNAPETESGKPSGKPHEGGTVE